MSIPLLVFGAIDLLLVLLVGLWIRKQYTLALTSIDEKRAGLGHYYRSTLAGLFSGEKVTAEGLLTAVHYAGLHLLLPLLGLGLYLRSDANFLFVILGGLVSMKLIQRLYPGTRMSERREGV